MNFHEIFGTRHYDKKSCILARHVAPDLGFFSLCLTLHHGTLAVGSQLILVCNCEVVSLILSNVLQALLEVCSLQVNR